MAADAAAAAALLSAVAAQLESSGTLPSMRSELRAQVSATLRASAPPPPPPPAPADARVIHALIRDYMVQTGLEGSLLAFDAETGEGACDAAADRALAARELGVAPRSTWLPLLYALVAAARAARLAADAAAAAAVAPSWRPAGPWPWGSDAAKPAAGPAASPAASAKHPGAARGGGRGRAPSAAS
jgi:hypothetical protein